jgi:hypothetical protein
MVYIAGPFDNTHGYLQWGGKLPGNEQWTCGLRMADTTGGNPAESDPTFLAALATHVTTYHQAALTGVSPLAKLSFVKFNGIGIDGKYLYQSTQEVVLADLAGGGAGAGNMPNQLALAVSLTTGFSRGPAHRGRFYLPMPTHTVGLDGLISTGAAGGVASTTTTFINGLNSITENFQVAVYSRKLGAPAHRMVTGNQVGRVIDTQRRRRRSLAEMYQS